MDSQGGHSPVARKQSVTPHVTGIMSSHLNDRAKDIDGYTLGGVISDTAFHK